MTCVYWIWSIATAFRECFTMGKRRIIVSSQGMEHRVQDGVYIGNMDVCFSTVFWRLHT